MPCDIIMESGFQPRRINQPYDTTVLNLSQAINNNVAFMLSDTPDGSRVATRVSKILEVIEVEADEV